MSAPGLRRGTEAPRFEEGWESGLMGLGTRRGEMGFRRGTMEGYYREKV